MKQIIERTVNYLLRQKDGTSLTMWEAVKAACPEEYKSVEDKLLLLTEQIVAACRKIKSYLRL